MTDTSPLATPSHLRVIALYGAFSYLHDLNAINGRGKRVPGGLSVPISHAGLRLDLIRREILDLANTEPEEAQHLALLFSKSEQLHIRQIGQELTRRLAS